MGNFLPHWASWAIKNGFCRIQGFGLVIVEKTHGIPGTFVRVARKTIGTSC